MRCASPMRYAITTASRPRSRATAARARPRATGSSTARANSARSAFTGKPNARPNACSAPSGHGRSTCACRTGFTSGGWRRWRRSDGIAHCRMANRRSPVPSLYDNLACDLSALQIDHRRTKDFCPIAISAAFREGQTVSDAQTGFNFVSHVAPADILEIRGDGAPALEVAWLARRIVTVDDLTDGIFSIQTGQRVGLAPLDRALQPSHGDRFRLGFGF